MSEAAPVTKPRPRFVDLRPGEGTAALWAFATFFMLLTAYYVLRPLRESLAQDIPWLFTATFVGALLAVPLWSALAARVRRQRLLAVAFQIFVLNLVLFYVALNTPGFETWAARGFYVWLSIFNLLAVSMFWSLVVDLFTQEQGKRLFGVIAAGGSAGAVCGPLITGQLVGIVGPTPLLLISALALELAAIGTLRLARQAPRAPGSATSDDNAVGGGVLDGIRAVFSSRYLGLMALYMFFITLTGTFGYMLQQQTARAQLPGLVERTRYFANVDLGASLLTLLVQSVFTGKMLTRLGVKAGLLLVPPLTALGFAAFALHPGLLVIAALHVTRRAAVYAIANPTREVLFTVTTREEKYKAKSFIETVVWRGGDSLSSWSTTVLQNAGLGVSGLAAVAVALALPWAGVGVALAHRHAKMTAEQAAR